MSRLWTPADLAVPPRIWIDGDQAVFTGSNLTSIANTGSEGGSFTVGGVPVKDTLNGLNGINCTATTQKLTKTVAAWGTSGVQFSYSVLKQASITGDVGLYWAVNANIAGSASTSGLCLMCGGELYLASHGYNAGQGPILHHSTSSGLSITTGNILETLIGTGQNAWVDGTSLAPFDGDTEPGSFPNIASTPYTWGVGWGAATQDGSTFQHMLLDYTPTTGERQQLEGWGAWKYNLQSQLPVGHPYKSAPPTVPTTTPISCQATSTPPALLKRTTSKPIVRTSTPLASLLRLTSKPIARTSTPPALLKRSTSKGLIASSTSVARLAKPVIKVIQSASTSLASLLRLTSKPLLASSTSAASLLAVSVRLVFALASSTSVALLKRATARAGLASSASVASLRRTAGKVLLASSTSIASCVAVAGRFVTALASSMSVASLRRSMARVTLVASASVASLRRLTSKAFPRSSASVASLLRGLNVAISAQASSVSAATLRKLSSFSITVMAASTSVASVALSIIPAVGQLVRRLTGRWSSAQLSGTRSSGKLNGDLQ